MKKKKSLSEIRNERGKTQEEMAKYLGISIVAYHLYETGQRKIPSEKVKKIVDILDIKDVNDIFLPSTFSLR